MLLGAAALALPGGCGGVDAGSPTAHRLHPRYEIAGSAQRLIGWHDEQLGFDCSFTDYIQGREHRCLPESYAVGDNYFADSGCQSLLAYDYDGRALHYALKGAANTCEERPKLYSVGEAVPSANVFSIADDGSCQPLLGFDDFQFYRLGAEASIDELASATEQPDLRGQLWLVTEDGAREPWGGWDGKRAVQPANTHGHLRWAPWIVAYQSGELHSDPGCQADVATKEPDSARCPLDAVLIFDTSGGDSCAGGVPVSYAELGPKVEMLYYSDDTTPCAAHGGNWLLDWEVGKSIDGELLPAGTIDEGDGPIKVRHATMNGVVIQHAVTDSALGGNGPPGPDDFIDVASGLVCAPLRAADGKTRCIPPPTVDLYYVDSKCTAPAIQVAAAGDTCPAPPLPALITASDDIDDPIAGTLSAWPVEDELPSGVQLYYSSNGVCDLFPLQEGATYQRLGKELPPTRFAEVTQKTE